MLQRLLIPEWQIDGWQELVFQLTHKSKYVEPPAFRLCDHEGACQVSPNLFEKRWSRII